MAKILKKRLWDAVHAKNNRSLKRLLKSKHFKPSDLDYMFGGETILYRAAYLENLDLVVSLIESGADINALSGDQGTAMHCAVNENCEDIASFLYEKGGDPYILNRENSSVLDLARDAGMGNFLNLVQESEKRKRETDSQKIIFSKKVFDYKVEEIYDFDDFTRMIVLTDLEKNNMSFQRDTFKNIQEESALQKAFNEHVKRGGVVPEQTVFPDRFIKPRSIGLKSRKS